MRRILWMMLLASCGAAPRPVHVDVADVRATGVAPPRPNLPPNPKLYAELPPIDGTFAIVPPRRLGFSRDDAYLGWAISTCDPCPLEFHFESPHGKPLDFAYHWDPEADARLADPEAARKKADAAVDRKLDDLGIEEAVNGRRLRGPFPYPDLIFASSHTRNDSDGTVTLLFGAHVVGHAPVFPIRIVLGPQPGSANDPSDAREQWLLQDPLLAYANVTRDGSDIGVVAIAGGAMWWETAGIARVPTRVFVGRVYNDTGMGAHKAGRFAQAAALFAEAEDANPSESLFSYNLACALTRAGDPRAKDALARAIRKGGPAIAARARTDEDFASVRAESWYRALVP